MTTPAPLLSPSSLPVYMDNHATTRLDPRVLQAMLPWLGKKWGNPGSIGHRFGDLAREAVAESRGAIAAAIGAHEQEIVFTSGATESNNLALRGIIQRPRQKGKHVVSVSTEHVAVLQPLRRLEKRGIEVTYLPVRHHGHPAAGTIDLDQFRDALRDDTCLVSVMLANNEIGVVQPIPQIAPLCHERGIPLHTDATQGVGKIPVHVDELGVDLLSFSAHKIYGPPGVGVLYVRSSPRPQRLDAQITGGGQQLGRRSGTLNVPGIVGLRAAIECWQIEHQEEIDRIQRMRDQLWRQLSKRIPRIELCGPALDPPSTGELPVRLPGNLNVSLGDVDGATLQLAMPDIAISQGAACSAESPEPSHVLAALGLPEAGIRSSLRFGLGRFNEPAEVEWAANYVADAVQQLRSF